MDRSCATQRNATTDASERRLTDLPCRITARMPDDSRHALRQPGIDDRVIEFDRERYHDDYIRLYTTAASFTGLKKHSCNPLPSTPPPHSISKPQPLTVLTPLVFATPYSVRGVGAPASSNSSPFGPMLPNDTTWEDNLHWGFNTRQRKMQDVIHQGNESMRHEVLLVQQLPSHQETDGTGHNREEGRNKTISRHVEDAHHKLSNALSADHHYIPQHSQSAMPQKQTQLTILARLDNTVRCYRRRGLRERQRNGPRGSRRLEHPQALRYA